MDEKRGFGTREDQIGEEIIVEQKMKVRFTELNN